jgi:hypothetical protein
MVEVKLNDLNVSKSLQRFAGLLNCKKIVQVIADLQRFAGLLNCKKIVQVIADELIIDT